MKLFITMFACLAAIAVLPQSASATCLTSQQLDYIDQLAAKLNASSSELRTFFEPMCDMGSYYTRADTDNIMNLTLQAVILHQNITQMQVDQKLAGINTTVAQNMKPYQDNWTAAIGAMESRISGSISMHNLTIAIADMVRLLELEKKALNSTDAAARVAVVEQRLNAVLDSLDSTYAKKSELGTQFGAPAMQASFDYSYIIAAASIIGIAGLALYLRKGKGMPSIIKSHHAEEMRPLVMSELPRTRMEAAGMRQLPAQAAVLDHPDEVTRVKIRKAKR